MTVYIRTLSDDLFLKHYVKSDVERISVWSSQEEYVPSDGNPENFLIAVLWFPDGSTQSLYRVVDLEMF